MPDNAPQVELNFIETQTLSRYGMIREIEMEFNIIRFCLDNMSRTDRETREMLDKIIIMPVRKLLCEKKSVLLEVCPEFKMFPLDGQDTALQDGLHAVLPPLGFRPQTEWLNIEDWRNQKVAYFNRTATDFTGWMTKYVYEAVFNSLRGGDKRAFESFMQQDDRYCNGDEYKGYSVINEADKNRVYSMMENAGYNTLILYNFIKHISDKRGAHIDRDYSIFISIFNRPGPGGFTLIECIALQMILAAETQIPELHNYWPNSLNVIETE